MEYKDAFVSKKKKKKKTLLKTYFQLPTKLITTKTEIYLRSMLSFGGMLVAVRSKLFFSWH